MRGSVFPLCFCRDPQTGKALGKKCPKLGKKGHAKWYFRYSAPAGADGKRRQPRIGPFDTKTVAEEELTAALARIAGGGQVHDRSLLFGAYLTAYAAGKLDVKASTLASIHEAVRLYWIPALGHLRLVDLRDHHVSEAVREMMKINRPLPEDEKPSEVLRRMIAARADDVRRELPPGEKRHKKSTKPLSPARIARMFAVLRAALNDAVPGRIEHNPCATVKLPKVSKVKPLPWTAPRVEAFGKALAKRVSAASATRELTAAERQVMWGEPPLRPSPVMVWMPAQTGEFLDFIESERLFALFCLVAYCGLRRDEAIALKWAEVDLADAVAWVRETGHGEGTKSEAGVRAVPLAGPVLEALRAWRKIQAADQLAWGRDWMDTDLVFTREDGTAVPGPWVSTRFETLAYRAGLPPVRFHDLRHGAASLAKAAGLDSKYIAALLGHARSSFTDDVYVLLFPEVANAAAEAAAAVVPRKGIAQREAEV
jgi:integrase